MQRVALLGCGRVTDRYVEVFRDELKGANVVAVCDLVQERANRRAKELKTQARYEYQELLRDPSIDAIIILTESGRHAEHARLALSANKHVIVEKPAALFVHEVMELQSLASQKGKMYAAILQNRYNPSIRALKSAVDSKRFGKTVLATIRLRWCREQGYYEDGWHGTWKLDGGVINQQALHHIDALQWICGPIEKVCAAQTNALNRLEAEDTTAAVVQFASGALGVIEATTAARPRDFEASISLVAEKGMVVIGGIALNEVHTWQFMNAQSEDKEIPARCTQKVPNGYGLSHGPLLQDIVDRLNRGETQAPITAQDAVGAIQLVHALYRSVEVGQWVNLKDHPVSERLGR